MAAAWFRLKRKDEIELKSAVVEPFAVEPLGVAGVGLILDHLRSLKSSSTFDSNDLSIQLPTVTVCAD